MEHEGIQDSGRLPSKDITPVLKGWEYESGTVNVRKISGYDGKPKLQMRLDLGLLQMELSGRPDGQRPHGHESLLEYFESLLGEHRLRTGAEQGFLLNDEQCQALRDEAEMYYRRYLSLFVLEEFEGVVRDTSRNLRVFDLCRRYGERTEDRMVLEQYRPYVIMMNARATASILYRENRHAEAMDAVQKGLRAIKRFFRKHGQLEAYPHANEVRILRRFAKDIRQHLPIDVRESLSKKLERAVKEERYEEAAQLRDELARLDQPQRETGV